MEHQNSLRLIKEEVLRVDFSYKHVHRIMFLIYETKKILETDTPIANKDIALHQMQKVIKNELMHLLQSESEQDIKDAFFETVAGFKLVLTYVAL